MTEKTKKNVSSRNEVKFYADISKLIEASKRTVQHSINSSMVLLYWSIGQYLVSNVMENEKAEYGKSIVENLSRKLTLGYGRGFEKSALFRMVKFYREFPDQQKVATLSQQLTWSHFIELIPIENELKRNFYVAMCSNENWNVRTLRNRRKSMLFERTAMSKKPEKTIRNDIDTLQKQKTMSPDLFYKDPYILDFLGLKDSYSEDDLENAILVELEKFILEMGSDFAFLARQKHFVLDGKDYFIDLLFYHRTLHRLVAVELKLGEFEPEYKGQVELYLRWLSKNEKAEGEKDPIALILCAEKSQQTIELMELDKGNIRVGQYLTKMPPKDILEQKLLLAIKNAKANL
jgi:predicted nuclease of restriction endonuclease-like (RecB) superfamily